MRTPLHCNAAPPCAARRRMAGAAGVEFTLLFPLILLLVFGVIEFGAALYDKAILTNASREAARSGVAFCTSSSSCSSSSYPTASSIQSVATNYCQSRLVTFANGGAQCTFPKAITPCTSTGADLSVQVSYTFTGLLIAQLVGGLTINAITTMVCE
ncbi:TadE/TadG family type IV pilus assembly protein [Ralstonia insidiosa]|jgi:Flp pilus assembly protein TadG|uniref:TadE family protein n=1 Tax=Ralstonia TaxID=48736 RepID=UPI000664B269|nr:TadE/TadG family type IV pilus assembly protein [Ralstonia insidiosa]KMW45264.1 pilus assembly protein TadE [Ralstonia sp. MD27]MBX3774485.1 pilus assembly protein [Ralstonia pickettii]NOZ16411.1 pilus assembly protein [Betaproteobacteria bacterium]MBA9859025.1 pilus assembly protein [Ralstonia insidiosa]MBA9873509.1 pilus assembly protein [Ralstonia insidiosa]